MNKQSKRCSNFCCLQRSRRGMRAEDSTRKGQYASAEAPSQWSMARPQSDRLEICRDTGVCTDS